MQSCLILIEFFVVEFEAHFPLSVSKALTRNPSDHVPLLWEADQDVNRRELRFKFEKWWLQHEEFGKIVESIWGSHVDGRKAIDRWQNRVKIFRRKA
jgi:hypothetical protein